MKKTKVYSYVITSDTGFAPNPFWGYCTLACCKPIIRKCANKNDWIIGTGSKKNVGNDKIVYLMRVTENPFSFKEYFNDKRFEQKKPNMYTEDKKLRRGDNIYKPLGNEKYKQLESRHSNGKKEDNDNKEHDLHADRVLVSNEFYYFGKKAIDIPTKLRFIIKKGPAHKSRFNNNEVKLIFKFIAKLKKRYRKGINGYPCKEWNEKNSCHKKKYKKSRCYYHESNEIKNWNR